MGLTRALAESGYETHLWFVGDPDLAGHEAQGRLELHRWCQWISDYHPRGVYDGEEGKQRDYASSLPPYLMEGLLSPYLRRGGQAVILAEEWQTVDAVLHLDWLLRVSGARDRVAIYWNANNTFCFDRIDWRRLSEAAEITTVSNYMSRLMRPLGVDAQVVPNGLSPDALLPPDAAAISEFRERLRDRTAICKMARWDPDKRWLTAVDIICDLKERGANPLFLTRGGMESYGVKVIEAAVSRGLRVVDRHLAKSGARGLLEAMEGTKGVDMLNLRSPVDSESRRLLFGGSEAVLANSSHEPFGLVGLETMAVGGVACTGGTGEDYAVPGRNALVLESADPKEFLRLFTGLKNNPVRENALRQAGRVTARRYAWPKILEKALLPRLQVFQYASMCRQKAEIGPTAPALKSPRRPWPLQGVRSQSAFAKATADPPKSRSRNRQADGGRKVVATRRGIKSVHASSERAVSRTTR
jgi:glycosyltransferase involved in cell wall biosynthesis